MEQEIENQFESPAGALRCRAELPEDEAFLREVYASARQEELDSVPWRPGARQAFLDSQFNAMRIGYATEFPAAEFSVILLGEQRVGRMVVDRGEQVMRLVDIALLPEFRGRGIGSYFLKRLANEAALARKALRLHVFKGSRPWRLYARLGFVKLEDAGPYEHLEWRAPDARQSPPSGPVIRTG